VTSTLPAPASHAPTQPAARGRLLLLPNTLDHGTEAQTLTSVLPHAVLQCAAGLRHWIVEDAKSARAYLKRVHEVVPLGLPLQSISIVELPRPQKGGKREPAPGADRGGHRPDEAAALLAPALEGNDIGLLSEAGLPAVADPGARVVAAAHALGLVVQPLAGPSALVLALAASGLDGQSFAFVGYLPQDPAARAARIRELEQLSRRMQQTQIFIETPYRNPALLSALLECAAPGTRLSVSVGLTLPGGWSRTATVAEWRRAPGAAGMPDRLPAVFVLQA